jgi:hypothetical protein
MISGGSMDQKDRIQNLIKLISLEILEFLREVEMDPPFENRWVPQKYINKALELNFVAVPKSNRDHRATGWFFSIIARMLEDEGQIEFKKINGTSYYRTRR